MENLLEALHKSAGTPDAPTPALTPLEEYEARRCVVCGARYPAFGFGPPLSRNGFFLWACFAHRTEVYDRLTGKPQLSQETERSPTNIPSNPQGGTRASDDTQHVLLLLPHPDSPPA